MNQKADTPIAEEFGIKALTSSLMVAWRQVCTTPGTIVVSSCLALIVWGPLGRPLFYPLVEGWVQEDVATAGFRREMVSYLTGFTLLVVVPLVLIRYRFKEPFRAYGLGLGDVRLGLLFMFGFIALTLVPFYLTAKNPAMWSEYPLLFRGMTDAQIKAQFSWSSFVTYELMYALFFFVIEFIFRGYLLFGLEPQLGPLTVLIQLLPYCTWHLAKPLPELIPTPIWGLAVAAITLRVRSLYYIFVAHWLLNVFLDGAILHFRGVW
jgi:membrane protease YdiL (CAAX protease family)